MTLAMQEGATYDCANQISIFDMSLKFGPDYLKKKKKAIKHWGKKQKPEGEQRSSNFDLNR